MRSSTVWPETPSAACTALPVARIWSATFCTVATGTANPTPEEVPELDRIAVFSPISSPCPLTSAPPELPGLIDASVWIRSPRTPVCPPRVRLVAETMPVVTVPSRPNGLPMATVVSPTVASSVANGTVGRSTASICRTATSVVGSVPTTWASWVSPLGRVTWTATASATTWLLVTSRPSAS